MQNLSSAGVVIGALRVKSLLLSITITFCMLGNFSHFCCQLLTFSQFFSKKSSFRYIIRMSNSLDPDQD